MTDRAPAPAVFDVKRSGVRLDKFLAEKAGCGRRDARALITAGRVRVDGYRRAASTRVIVGQRVELQQAGPHTAVEPQIRTGELDVLQESTGWLAVNKPAGLHSVAGRSGDSVAELLKLADPDAAAISPLERDAGLVNRLDHDTSGVLLAARDRGSWLRLREEFAEHRVTKHYLALVDASVPAQCTVDQPLARRRSRVRPPHRGEKSYPALTTFHPLDVRDGWSLVLATMRTGVTHQIRAHAALAGFPILGDLKYGDSPAPPGTRAGHLLHAQRLIIPDVLDVTAPIPSDFCAALAHLRGD